MQFEKIYIFCDIASSIEKAWLCYTEPKHIIHWNFASDDWCCPSASNDLTVGGKYKARMEAKDGSWGFDFEGTYLKVLPQKNIVYQLADGRTIDIKFSENNGNCKIEIVFDAETENSLELQKSGWQAILDQYKKYVQGLN
jgi:uncharacterized protein YndB with AHSA1/START domain